MSRRSPFPNRRRQEENIGFWLWLKSLICVRPIGIFAQTPQNFSYTRAKKLSLMIGTNCLSGRSVARSNPECGRSAHRFPQDPDQVWTVPKPALRRKNRQVERGRRSCQIAYDSLADAGRVLEAMARASGDDGDAVNGRVPPNHKAPLTVGICIVCIAARKSLDAMVGYTSEASTDIPTRLQAAASSSKYS